jgi:hypothetical protein
MTVNEEFDRFMLRTRWLRWALRKLNGRSAYQNPKLIELSKRLTAWKPCWEERYRGKIKQFTYDNG